MTSELLKCTICPKLPYFSDTSHLLTHVSSKGHLAHLHKLQIRGHQDVTAGHQLGAYNRWFQEHNLAELLSERLHQKEAKQVSRTFITNHRAQGPKQGDPSKSDAEASHARHATEEQEVAAIDPQAELLRNVKQEDNYLLNQTPVRRSQRLQPEILASSPSKCCDCESDVEQLDLDPQLKVAYGSPKLKGTIWPGMDLFDAANEETKRKRNQKKDSSVLKRMQHASGLVQPYEVVHSASGHVLKQRHMDDLETDSLVEGESPLMKQSPRRRLQSSAKASGAAPQRVKKARKRGSKIKSPLANKKRVRSLSKSRANVAERSYMPDVENQDQKPNADTLKKKETKTSFTIYEAGSPDIVLDSTLEYQANPFLDSESKSDPYATPRLSFVTPPWLKPQNQLGQTINPFRAFAMMQSEVTTFDAREQSKARAPLAPKPTNIPLEGESNPIHWKNNYESVSGPSYAAMSDIFTSPSVGLHGDVRSVEELSVHAKNPLAGALTRFQYVADAFALAHENNGSPVFRLSHPYR